MLKSSLLLKNFPTGAPRRIHVDITSIHQRSNFDAFPRRFHVFFRCNFADRKIHVASTYVYRCYFTGRKIHVFSTYFFRCNFDGRKIYVVSTYFFDVISLIKLSTLFLPWSVSPCFYLFFSTFLCRFSRRFSLVTLNSWLLQDCSL